MTPIRRSTHASQRCGAHNIDGSPCGAWAIRGARVCGMHGGRAPQVKAAAEDRMRSLVHPAISALEHLIEDNDIVAARYVLDYAGFKAKEKVETTGDTTIRVEYAETQTAPRPGPSHTNGHVA